MHAILQTPRLNLRLLTPSDADFILELVNDPAWLRFIGDRNIRTRSDAEAYIEKCLGMYRLHGVCSLAVEQKSNGSVIGICGLLKRDSLSDVDLGFAFLAHFRGQGFAREAAAAVLQFGYGTLNLDRIMALTHPENEASKGLLRKLGFRFETSRLTADGSVESQIFAYAGSR